MADVLIQNAALRAIRKHPEIIRQKITSTLAHLKEGKWTGGTRVKQILGVSAKIFEARVNRSYRVIFTQDRKTPDMEAGDACGAGNRLIICVGGCRAFGRH